MPASFSCIIHTNILIISCKPDPERSSNLFRIIKSKLWVNEGCEIQNILPVPLPIEIHTYFPDTLHLPDEDSLVAIQGILSVYKDHQDILLSVRGIHITQYPGDPEGESYIEHCTEPQLASLTVVGTVGKSVTPPDISSTKLRYFELKTSVFESKDNHHEYMVICFYPDGNRFKNTPCPNKHALVFVFGQIIGLHDISGCIAVLVDDLVFLSTKGQSLGEDGAPKESTTTVSPQKKWDGWGSRGSRGIKRKGYTPTAGTKQRECSEEHIPDSDTSGSPLTIVSSASNSC